jgi:hypothetical protein
VLERLPAVLERHMAAGCAASCAFLALFAFRVSLRLAPILDLLFNKLFGQLGPAFALLRNGAASRRAS